MAPGPQQQSQICSGSGSAFSSLWTAIGGRFVQFVAAFSLATRPADLLAMASLPLVVRHRLPVDRRTSPFGSLFGTFFVTKIGVGSASN